MKKITYLLLLIWFSSLFTVKTYSAEILELDRVAVAVVLDNSGSIKNSDPANNRLAATRVILNLLTDNDYLSITAFNNEAINTFPMSLLEGVKDRLANTSLDLMPLPTGATDYLKALNVAERNLDEIKEPGVRKFIIFLTDGKPDLEDPTIDMAAYSNAIFEKAQTIGIKGYPIYTVGFGEIDQAVLEQMASQSRGQFLKGESGTVAQSFFEILRELKNRYVLFDQQNEGDQKFLFEVDEYTSHIAVLVQTQNGNDKVQLEREDGYIVQPVFSNETNHMFSVNAENKARTYTLSGHWKGRVQIVRDTKTKLWITQPTLNEQIPFDEKLKAKIIQTGTTGHNTQLEILLKQSENRISIPTEITPIENGYEVAFGSVPQTGRYVMEVSLRNRNQLIAMTSSAFEVKNLPLLFSSVLNSPPTLIKGEKQRITAALRRNESTIINSNEFDVVMQIKQGQEVVSLQFKDDGSLDSGDVIKGDGIYSLWFTPDQTGPLNYSISARGLYNGSTFLIGGTDLAGNVDSPGVVEIQLLDSGHLQEGIVNTEVQLKNNGSYSEVVNVFLDDEVIAQNILLEPQATVIRKLSWAAKPGITDVQIKFSPGRAITRLSKNEITVNIQEKKSDFSNFLPIFAVAGAVLVIVSIIIFVRRRPKKGKVQVLKGELVYNQIGSTETKTIKLNGSNEMRISIGKTREGQEHIDSDADPTLKFSVYPIDSREVDLIIEIRSAPPGIFKVKGVLATSAVLSPGDLFEMEKFSFQYVSNAPLKGPGQNVLEGRL